MAGERLFSYFKDDSNEVWKVSIYDTSPTWNVANSEGFKLGSEGVVMRHEGDNEQQHQPLIGSSAEFTLYEENSDHTQTLDLLYSFPEGRLLLEIYRDPDGDNTIYWRGIILSEQVERMDEPMPTAVRITATDGLSNLREVDFDLTLGGLGSDGLSIATHIVRCLHGIQTTELYGSTDVLLRYLNDTQLHNSADDTDPLDTIIGQVPVKVLDDGTTEAYSCYDILHSIATCFNARMFLSDGVWWLLPINAHQRVSDGENITLNFEQVDKSVTAQALTAAQVLYLASNYRKFSGSSYVKLAGHVFTHLPPVLSVERTRRYDGNMYVVRGNDDTIVTSGVNITLADSDRTYEVGARFRVSGFLEFQVSPDATYEFNEPGSRVNIELEINLNVDSKYYQPEEWTTDSTDRYVITLSTFDRNQGANINTSYSFITAPLATEEDGMDVTAVVKFFNLDGTNVTSAYTSEDFYLDFGIEVVDDNGANGDFITYRATYSSENRLVLDQGEVLFGDNVSHSAQGKLYALSLGTRIENDWKTSQTAGPLPLHRIGVEEALARQKFATKIHRGTVYDRIEMWQTMIEDSEYYVPFEMSKVMNRNETTVERYKIAFDSGSITSADDPPRALGIRGGLLDMVNGVVNTVTAQVQQPKLEAGVNPVTPMSGRSMSDTAGNVSPFYPVKEIAHTNGSTYTIGEKQWGFIFMSGYSGAIGNGTIYLPPVDLSEGRLFRFKSDDTISANGYYIIRPDATDHSAGTRIDGSSSFIQNRDYDGIAILCHASQWYVVQRKSK